MEKYLITFSHGFCDNKLLLYILKQYYRIEVIMEEMVSKEELVMKIRKFRTEMASKNCTSSFGSITIV